MQTPECATKLRFVLPPRFPGATDRAGKQNSPTCDPLKRFNFLKKNGAGEAIRTPDPNLGNIQAEYKCLLTLKKLESMLIRI
jgi:hypothetical protein